VALREFITVLEQNRELHRTLIEIDPVLEVTEIARRAIKEKKPALLIERPKGSKYPLVINHYASERRIELALGRHPEDIGSQLIHFLEEVFPPTIRAIIEHKKTVRRLLRARPKVVSSGISQEIIEPPDLGMLPIQVCWPKDGGKFITYGQVITLHPQTGKRNIGIYRMHVFDKTTTGMHWQIQKGGGFHYYYAERFGKKFELAVALGTSPALTLATVAALPEGIDEAMFAGFLQNRRIEFTKGKTISINVPARAEFILEGLVEAKERKIEGPFGDHFGHYSPASEFPVFHLTAITHRRNPIYPATVVGKPPMEDKFLGNATQQMLCPLIKLIHKEVNSLWAYYEAGFHNLLVASIEQRYQKEAIKASLGMMGTDQLSLTKCMIMVSAGVNVQDWLAVMREIRVNFDPHYDFIMIPKVPLDTLDFTSYTMNLGSKMIIDATRKPERVSSFKSQSSKLDNLKATIHNLHSLDSRIVDSNLVEDTLLLVRIHSPMTDNSMNLQLRSDDIKSSDGNQVIKKLVSLPELSALKIIAAVSPDVDIHDEESYIWGIFTRFDCERDVVFTEQKLQGISPIYKGIVGIDATWKPGYPEPLQMREDIAKLVDEKWGRIWK
jgi:menaquinone biosynthesis decarboxylase